MAVGLMSPTHLLGACPRRTRTRQTASPFLVRVQNSDLRGVGDMHMTVSGGRLGSAGTVESCLAADVGKYISQTEGRD